ARKKSSASGVRACHRSKTTSFGRQPRRVRTRRMRTMVEARTASQNLEQRQIVAKRADQITPQRLRWLWPERIPLGKITIFAGVPGEGKSLATIDIAARVTTARKYFDAVNPLLASEVLFIAEEDEPGDALVPRLMAAGADRSKVHIQNGMSLGGQVTTNRVRL